MHVRRAAGLLHLARHLLELLARARDQQHLAAGLSDLERGLEPDPARGAGDHDPLACDRVGQRAIAEQVGIEVALPVVPQPRRVGGERGHGDAGAGQRALGVAGVEAAAEVAVLHRRRRDSQVAVELVADPLHGRQRLEAGPHRLGDRVGHVRVDAHRELRRVGGLGELVERLADLHRLGAHEVEGVAGQLLVGQVGDVVHRLGHEVDGHDVGVAALRTGQRRPLGQRVAQLLEQLEEVVGTVDLVHLAGLRVAHHDAGPEDQRARPDLLAHQPLGLVLGAVVGVRELLALVEHVLLEHALVEAGHGDRAGVVEAADLDRVGELDHVPGALGVGALHRVLVGGHVVDRGEVEEVVDRLAEALDAEPRLGEVAGHTDDSSLGRVQASDQRVQLAARALAHEHVDGALAAEQLGHQMPADEARCAGDEVVQGSPSLYLGAAILPRWQRRPSP